MSTTIGNTPFYSKLQGHIPDKVYAELDTICSKFNIDGPRRLSNLLGQCAHESGNFTAVYENLNYSAQGLANTWPTRYAVNSKATPKVPNDLAKKIQRQPEQIANNTYANRIGNSTVESGDGWKYRGRGYIQLTGKSNYKALGDYLNIDLISQPDLVATTYPLASAGFFFMRNNLWTICDRGTDNNTIESVTRIVNGGTHGLADRIKYTQQYFKILSS